MTDIYSMAKQVVAWLGMGDDASEYAMDLLNGTVKKISRNGLKNFWDNFSQKQACLDTFRRLEYWSRLWIVQELRFSKNTLLLCGRKCVDTTACFEIMQKISWEFRLDPVDVLLNLERKELDHWQWTTFMKHFGEHRCLDLRDRIYGLQGFVWPHYRIDIDYALSAEHLLAQLLKSAANEGRPDTVLRWTEMRVPQSFANALLGPSYPTGVLMVLQALVWSLALPLVLEVEEYERSLLIMELLRGARTINHRQLSAAILHRFQENAPKDLEWISMWVKMTRSHGNIPYGPARKSDERVDRSYLWKVPGLLATLRNAVRSAITESAFEIIDGQLQHKNKTSYLRLLQSTSWNDGLLKRALMTWDPDISKTEDNAPTELFAFANTPVNKHSLHSFRVNAAFEEVLPQ